MVELAGVGLHGGRETRVTLRARPGPVSLRVGDREARVSELRVASSDFATTAAAGDGELRVGTVEHLFAALAGLRIHGGVEITVEGDELPLLDGGAAAWTEALSSLQVPAGCPSLTVARDEDVSVGSSVYSFHRTGTSVSVAIEFGDVRIAPDASWSGDSKDFALRIAPARTFGFARDIRDLARRGLVSHVTPESVVLFTSDEVLFAGRPVTPDEPARHKLLDLLGDLYLHGGPPLGSVHATRPGHSATHAAISLALSRGILRSSVEERKRQNRETEGEQDQAVTHDVAGAEAHEPEQG